MAKLACSALGLAFATRHLKNSASNNLPCKIFQPTASFFGPLAPSQPKTHKERRVFGWSPEQVFNVVADVDSYKLFLPWCTNSRFLQINSGPHFKGATRLAELCVGFPPFQEKYTSAVTVQRPQLVKAVASNSLLFKKLENIWKFSPGPTVNGHQTCLVDFYISFLFSSPVHAAAANMFFEEVSKQMVDSFEKRCVVLYGPG
eukprot:Colp12_sorted_trinity150504_noHs@35692